MKKSSSRSRIAIKDLLRGTLGSRIRVRDLQMKAYQKEAYDGHDLDQEA